MPPQFFVWNLFNSTYSQGRVKFPTGGMLPYRGEPASALCLEGSADPVRGRSRR
jgi:hypothetical protein